LTGMRDCYERTVFMMDKYIYTVGLMGLLTGCTMRDAGYTALGAGAGAGIGYSIHHNVKDTVIGGLGGAMGGNVLAQWQDHHDKVKQDKANAQAAIQAKVDTAVNNWDENTGKNFVQKQEPKRLVSIVVPKREENGVVYDQQEITLEDYQ